MKTKRGENWKKTKDNEIFLWSTNKHFVLSKEDIEAMAVALCDKDKEQERFLSREYVKSNN